MVSLDNANHGVEHVRPDIPPFTSKETKYFPQYGIAAGDTMFTGREFIQEEEMCRFEVNGVRNYDE